MYTIKSNCLACTILGWITKKTFLPSDYTFFMNRSGPPGWIVKFFLGRKAWVWVCRIMNAISLDLPSLGPHLAISLCLSGRCYLNKVNQAVASNHSMEWKLLCFYFEGGSPQINAWNCQLLFKNQRSIKNRVLEGTEPAKHLFTKTKGKAVCLQCGDMITVNHYH